MSTKERVNKVIEKAIKENDIGTLKILKDAFDKVHESGETVEISKPKLIITPENLPEDEDYEFICKILETPLRIPATIVNSKPSLLSDLWMGSLSKHDTIKVCKDGIMFPKFDGCSAGLKFVKDGDGKIVLFLAQTRGIKANITSKMRLLVTDLLDALNACERFKKLSELMICIRGEVVIKDKELTDSAPAPYIAGKINGGDEVFQKALDTIEFVPYEIMRLTEGKNKIRMTQEECFEFLKEINQLKFEPLPMEKYDLEEVKTAFDEFSETLSQPLDGVVYCSKSWTYPITEAETMPASYGKWAWKPSKEETSHVTGFEYSIGRDGKIEIMMTYDEITIDNKNYSRAKIAIARLLALKGIGVGSEITVRLAAGISPFISDFIPSDDIKEYKLPKRCPFCKSSLKLSQGANTTLKCLNVNCPEIKLQKYKNFLKVIGIKGIAEKTIRKLKTVSLESIIDKHLDEDKFKTTIMKLTVQQLFQALGFGGKQTVLKSLKGTPLEGKGDSTIDTELDNVLDVLKSSNEDEDEFLEEIHSVLLSYK